MRTLLLSLALTPLLLAAQAPPKAELRTATTKPGAPTKVNGGPDLIKWLTIEEAQAQAKKVPKPLMVDVYTSWCGPCKMLDANTFHDARLAEYVNKNFYPVKFNAEGGTPVMFKGEKLENPDFNPGQVGGRNGTHQLTYKIAVTERGIAYPTVVYLDSDMNVLAPVAGYLTPDQMEPILHYFGGSHYKTKDYQTFMGDFKGKWTPQ